MTRTWIRVPRLHDVLRTVALAVSVWLCAVHASGDDLVHVRSSSSVIRGVMEDAMERSPTFLKLARAINLTDGIVYVEEGVCRHSVRACLTQSVTAVAGFRFLRILIDTRGLSTLDGLLDLMATIGHELCHAMEVLGNRALTTAAAVYQFYARESPTSNDSFETAAAVAIGVRIRSEVGQGVDAS